MTARGRICNAETIYLKAQARYFRARPMAQHLNNDFKKRFTALVVDDDEDVRNLTKRALLEYAITTTCARDGQAGLEILRNRSFDVLITDLRMPKKHGHQLAQEVLDSPNHPVVCIISSLDDPRLNYDLCRRGISSLDRKPLNFKSFAAKIRGILDRHDASKTTGGDTNQNELSAESVRMDLDQITASFEMAIQKLKAQRSQLEKGYVDSVRLLTGLMNSQSGDAGAVHANRVESMAKFIGEKMGLANDDMSDLQLAALLHEIGQFSMPDRIRQAPPWKYSPEDRKMYMKYPVIGATLLSEIGGSGSVVQVVESHCENFDGSGFPQGLSGAEIPLSSRILRIADGFDSFIMYSDSKSPIEAGKEHLSEKLGSLYDPVLFPFTLQCLEEREDTYAAPKTEAVIGPNLREGMKLAESVYDDDGRLLSRDGVLLTRDLARRLGQLLGDRVVRVIMPADK